MTFHLDNLLENKTCSLSEKQAESVFYLNCVDFRPLPQKPRHLSESETLPIESEEETVEIDLASQFYTWLGSLNDTTTNEEGEEDSQFMGHLCQQQMYCSSIIQCTNEILLKLKELKEKYNSVSQKTSSLHETCESLLQKQTDLSQKAGEIEEKLKFFNLLASIEAKLNARNAVMSSEKMDPIFESIDSSIAFLEAHREFKDTAVYLLRFKICLGTALEITKDAVKSTIRRVVMEIVDLGDAITSENSFILLYGRFRSQGPGIRSMMELLELRVSRSREYREAIFECQSYYLSKREALVQPVAQISLTDLTDKYSTDHCELFRTTVSFMLHMCEDEVSLFHRFFLTDESKSATENLDLMLASLCRCAYDSLRPFLIHINHIEILTALCDLLKHEFIEEQMATNNPNMAAFSEMCDNLLADVQQRLIFRAHIYIKSQILDYVPSPGDLAYPEKLEMMEQISNSLFYQKKEPLPPSTTTDETPPNENQELPARKSSASAPDFHGMWYPTVRRTLVCISNLSRCIDTDSFQGLAQNCMSACVQSLSNAQRLIGPMRAISDGQLFLIKHLLILREQMAPFNVEFRIKETSLNFSDLKNAAYNALPKMGSKLFDLKRANAVLRLILEGPNVVDVDLDSRRQLDKSLKVTCEAFIAHTISTLTADIIPLLANAKDSAKSSAQTNSDLLGPLDVVKCAVSSALRRLSAPLPSAASDKTTTSPTTPSTEFATLAELRRKLMLYLSNQNTVAIIMRPVEVGVVNCWRQLANAFVEKYSNEDRMIIGCPTDSQIRLFFHR